MKHKSGIGATSWPRRPRGGRRRATAEQAIRRQRLWGPAGWLIRVFLLIVVAVPSLIITSPSYVAYADKLPDVNAVANDIGGTRSSTRPTARRCWPTCTRPGTSTTTSRSRRWARSCPRPSIAIEDRNFYSEPGVDPAGIARAAMVDWQSHENVEGASTITQQLVKMRLVGNERDARPQDRARRSWRSRSSSATPRTDPRDVPEQRCSSATAHGAAQPHRRSTSTRRPTSCDRARPRCWRA